MQLEADLLSVPAKAAAFALSVPACALAAATAPWRSWLRHGTSPVPRCPAG